MLFEYPIKLSPFGEKPPPETDDSEWHIEQNQSIPFSFNRKISNIVIPKYIFHKEAAVFLIRGVNLSSVGPGASAKNSCRPAIAN